MSDNGHRLACCHNMMNIPTDNELLLASGRGDRDAFTVLVQRHHRAIIYFVHRFLATGDRATAEDLAQRVFLSAWRYAPTFEPRAEVSTWLFKIATNACLNHRRYVQSRAQLVERNRVRKARLDDDRQDAGDRLAEHERAERLRAALAGLSPTHRTVILLRYFHDFSYAQIAEIMSTSTSAVDSLLHRARRALHDKLSPKKDRDSPQVSSL